MGLPVDRRLRRSADINRVVRQGRRVRVSSFVLHHLAVAAPSSADVAVGAPSVGGPRVRVAFAAPRSIGVAVVRNRVRRRVQAQLASLLAENALDADLDLVIRLLPASTTAESDELGSDLRTALRRAGHTRG